MSVGCCLLVFLFPPPPITAVVKGLQPKVPQCTTLQEVPKISSWTGNFLWSNRHSSQRLSLTYICFGRYWVLGKNNKKRLKGKPLGDLKKGRGGASLLGEECHWIHIYLERILAKQTWDLKCQGLERSSWAHLNFTLRLSEGIQAREERGQLQSSM